MIVPPFPEGPKDFVCDICGRDCREFAEAEESCGHLLTSHTVDSTGEGWCNDCDNGFGAICHEFEEPLEAGEK